MIGRLAAPLLTRWPRSAQTTDAMFRLVLTRSPGGPAASRAGAAREPRMQWSADAGALPGSDRGAFQVQIHLKHRTRRLSDLVKSDPPLGAPGDRD